MNSNNQFRTTGCFRRIGLGLAALSALMLMACASSKRDFDPKHDGRFARLAVSFPLTPFIYSWMGYHILTEERGPHEVAFDEAIQYDPKPLSTVGELKTGEVELLNRFAPILIQQTDPHAAYDPAVNELGRPLPMQTLEHEKYVSVDTAQPSIYAFITEAELDGMKRAQLNYTYWFPEHPSMGGGFDPEAGKIEGITFRMTLGPDNTPLFFETVFNCGCYHRVYPSAEVEKKAREQYGPPAKGRFTSIAKPVRFKIDFYAPEAVDLENDARPVIFSAAGNHQPLHIGSESEVARLVKNLPKHRESQLRDYAELTHGGIDNLGIFGKDKLVVGADRPETLMLFPTGLYHAGTPRRRFSGSQCR